MKLQSPSSGAIDLAVMPARGGSVRVPRKNVRDFGGQPMLHWPLRTVIESGCFDRVIVSTDDEEIASIATRSGAEVPFSRPPTLADDHTGTRAVLRHAVAWWHQEVGPTRYVACVYPTAAFLSVDAVRSAFELLDTDPALDCAVTVAAYPHPIERALLVDDHGRLRQRQPGHETTRTQDVRPAHFDVGQLYLWRSEALLDEGREAQRAAVHVPRWRAFDIDDEDDWRLAESVFIASVDKLRPRRDRG